MSQIHPAPAKRGAPKSKKPATKAVDPASRRDMALGLKVAGATDHAIARQLGYLDVTEVVRDLSASYEAMAVLEPADARKLTSARIGAEILRLERAYSDLTGVTPVDRLECAVKVAGAKARLLSLLAKVEGTMAPTLNLHAGRVDLTVGRVHELPDEELERIARDHQLPPPGAGGEGAEVPGEDARRGGEAGV